MDKLKIKRKLNEIKNVFFIVVESIFSRTDSKIIFQSVSMDFKA